MHGREYKLPMSRMVDPLRNSGFTLVEMAVVLMIVGLLLGGLVPTITSQMDTQRTGETRRQMNEINEALLGFAVVNGRLPCPAQATLVTGTANAGIEAVVGNKCACQEASGSTDTIAVYGSAIECANTSVTGVLPWATLGIAGTDAWNRRYTYRVTTLFADKIAANTFGTGCSATSSTSSFAICSTGAPDILDATSGNFVAENVPAVFVSHGKNGYGARLPDGSQIPDTDGGNDEKENSDNDLSFVSHEFSLGYDDLIGWISPGILVNRMVAAGKLP